jgi:hypothetical protein
VDVALGVQVALGLAVHVAVKVALGVRLPRMSTGSARKLISQRTSGRAIHPKPSSKRIKIQSNSVVLPTASTSSPVSSIPRGA